MRHTRDVRYSILVRNRPGELAKVTGALMRDGVPLSGVRVASVGGRASIELRLPAGAVPRRPRGRRA